MVGSSAAGRGSLSLFLRGFLELWGFGGAVDAVAELLQELQHVRHAEAPLVAGSAVTLQHPPVGVAADRGRADAQHAGRFLQGELRIEKAPDQLLPRFAE